MDKSSYPLVSLVVITYNSASFILETLESAKTQTYLNLELIISDDCSSDNTFEICKKWKIENKRRFNSINLVKTAKNSGIAANCNNGLKLSRGEWIKIIAGDDCLKANCIELFIDYIKKDSLSVINALHSKMDIYQNSFSDINYLQTTNPLKYLFADERLKANHQYSLLLRDVYYVGAPSTFYRRGFLNQINGFDEGLPYEDWPLYLKITKAGFKIHYLDKVTVNYRIHASSIFNLDEGLLFNDFFIKDLKVYKTLRRNNLPLLDRINEDFFYFFQGILFKYGFNRITPFSKTIYRIVDFTHSKTKRIIRLFLEMKIKQNL